MCLPRDSPLGSLYNEIFGAISALLDFRMGLWYNENMTYKIYDENLPHDRYEVAEVLQNSDGTKIVLEGLSHIVTVNFGFVEALCICDEGRRIESYHQIPEIQAYRKADFEGNPLYIVESSEFMNWLMKESCGFAFDDIHFSIITENDFLDIAAPFPPKIEIKEKI